MCCNVVDTLVQGGRRFHDIQVGQRCVERSHRIAEVGVRERDVVILKKKFRFSSITLQPGILGILLGLMGGIARDCVREVSLA